MNADKERKERSVRKVTATELREVAAVLARAFYDDPGARWFFPDDQRRRALLERAFHFYLRKLWFSHDACFTTPSVVGAAIWLPPGKWQVSIVRQILLLPGLAVALGSSLGRTLRGLAALEADHPMEQHYYLPFVGVEPNWQGRGIGKALLVPILDQCDRESIPAYLEASSPLNFRLYESHRFEVTEEFTLGQDSPPLWRMWREPRQVSRFNC